MAEAGLGTGKEQTVETKGAFQGGTNGQAAPVPPADDLPDIGPEALLTWKEIKRMGKLATITLILNKQDRLADIQKRMEQLAIPALSMEDILNKGKTTYDGSQHYDKKGLKNYSTNYLWLIFDDMQQYEAGLYAVITRSCAAMRNNQPVTAEELEKQRRFAREEDEAMGVVQAPTVLLPEYTRAAIKSMDRSALEEALISMQEEAHALQQRCYEMGVRLAMYESRYGTCSEQARYTEETELDDGFSDGPSESQQSGETGKPGQKLQGSGSRKTADKDGDQKDPAKEGGQGKDGEQPKAKQKRGQGTKGSGKQKEAQKEEEGQQKKAGYGKADNKTRPRRTKDCEKKNTQELPKTTVIHGQKSDAELMELFGIENPDDLNKVSMVLSRATSEVVMIPAIEVEVLHQFASYVYNGNWAKAETPGSIKLISGSKLSVDLLANILDSVTYQHLPEGRVWKEMDDWGFNIGKDAVGRWINTSAVELLEPLYLRMQEIVLSYAHIHIDETFFKVVHDGRKTGSQSYMWVVAPGEYENPRNPIRLFVYDETRGTDVLRGLLKDYSGTISCDGWGSYKTYKKERKKAIKLAACWVHVRRKFVKLCKRRKVFKLQKEKRDSNIYYICYRMLKDIFDADRKYKDATPEERREGREKHVRPLVDAFFEYLKGLVIMPNSLMEAVNYALDQEEDLRTFLDDGFVPMTNSEAERVAGYFALSRNGFKQIDSIDGAYALSVILSIGASAQASGANGFVYFKYLLERLPKLIEKYGRPKGGVKNDLSWADQLLPWSDEYKAYEKETMGLYRAAGVKAVEHIYQSLGYTVMSEQAA